MLLKTFLLVSVCLAVSLGYPVEMFVQGVAESNSFDDFDNYIPRYDDLPNYNHPNLNHAKNESNIHLPNSATQEENFKIDSVEKPTNLSGVSEISTVPASEEGSSTPLTIRVITTADGIPTLELGDGKVEEIGNNTKNVGDASDNLIPDFDQTDKTTKVSVVTVTPTYIETTTNLGNENDGDTQNDDNPNVNNFENNNIDDLGTTVLTNTLDGSTFSNNEMNTTTTVTTTSTITSTEMTTAHPTIIFETSSSTKNIVVTSEGIDIKEPVDDNKNNSETTEKEILPTEKPQITELPSTFNISEADSPINETTRNPREEAEKNESEEAEKDDPEFADKESDKESQEDGSSSEEDEEEDTNMVTSLLSALLGGLSKPDGSIDLEAIVGLVGSLSTQNDDGTYDFQGITDLLKGFFGGGGADGGGSDIGAFTGGLLGAVIKGIANPPGGKGVGILTAKILGGILPALSVQPAEDGKPSLVKPGGIDIGGFLGGFVKTLFGASKDVNPVKFLISTITSLSNSKPSQSKGKKENNSNDT